MFSAKLNIHWVFCTVRKIEITFKEFQIVGSSISRASCAINLIFE